MDNDNTALDLAALGEAETAALHLRAQHGRLQEAGLAGEALVTWALYLQVSRVAELLASGRGIDSAA